jgi:solute carrier family 6 amino acid transporter-like protein 5/7/9/14
MIRKVLFGELIFQGGIYVFTLLNDYSAGFCLILLAFSEVTTVMYLYGINNFIRDVQLMLGVRGGCFGNTIGPTGWYWRVTWTVTSPLFLLMILVFSFVYYAPSKYGDYEFTKGAEIAGWIIACASIIMVPIFAVIQFVRNRFYRENLRKLWRPTVEWCPAHEREKRVAQAQFQFMDTFRSIAPGSPVTPSSPNTIYPSVNLMEKH